MPDAASLTRRQGLLALAIAGTGAALAACTSGESPAPATPSEGSSTPSPAQDAVADENALIASYASALSSFPDADAGVTAVLTLIRDQHAQHRDALGGGADASPAVAASGTLAEAIADLLAAERAAARGRIRACVEAADPQQARLLALIGASEASHVPALKDLAP